MRKNFTLIPFRKLTETIDVDKICLENNLELPTVYKIFLETFLLGKDNINRDVFYSKEFEDYFDCSAYIFNNRKEVGFICFLDILEAINLYQTGEFGADYFPIASSEGIGLTICIKGENIEKIYFEDTDGLGKKLVANNIFEFLRGIEIVKLDEKFLPGQVKYSSLYKKFGNEYWEVINIT